MARSTRLAILGGTLLLVVAGTALATQTSHPQPNTPAAASHEPESPPSADDLANAVDRLKASGIDATAGQLSELAADYGLGGAIRLLAWADAKGISLSDLKARRDDGNGWGQIAKAYTRLESLTGNPMVRLNRAVAVAMVDGPASGLALLEGLELRDSHRLHAVRAHLLEDTGDLAAAARSYAAAAARTDNAREREYLVEQAARVSAI